MVKNIILGGGLFVTWLLLSGHYHPFVVISGVGSCIASVVIVRRMDAMCNERYPIQITPQIFSYWLWLVWEIIKSNVDVARRVLAPRLRISPRIISLDASQQTALFQTILANSITLTPGTVTVDIEEGILLVHALSEDSANDLLEGKFEEKIARVIK